METHSNSQLTPSRSGIEKASGQRFFLSNAVVFASLLLALFFPSEGTGQKLLLGAAAYGILPALFLRVVLREPLKNYGLGWGRLSWVWNVLLVVGSVALFGAISWSAFSFTEPGKMVLENPENDSLRKSFLSFVAACALLGWSIAFKEFFFRGFFLFTWKRKFHAKSILFHAILIVMVSYAEAELFQDEYSIVLFALGVAWSCMASLVAFLTGSVFVSFSFSFFSAILLLLFSMIVP